MRRLVAIIVVLVVLIGVIAGALWLWRRPSGPAAVPPGTPQASPLALGVVAYSAAAGDDVAIVVRAFDRRARQSGITRRATGGQWKGSAAQSAAAPVAAPDGWIDRVRVVRADGTTIEPAARRHTPDGRGLLTLAASTAPARGIEWRVVLDVDGQTIQSSLMNLAPAPANAHDLGIARGRVDEVLGRWDRVLAAGLALARDQPTSPWGHYFEGVAREAAGNATEARAAFQRALNRTSPGLEPPIGLVVR